MSVLESAAEQPEPIKKEKPKPAEKGIGKKEQVIEWLLKEKSHQYLSGSTAKDKLRQIGVDVTVRYINDIKKELKLST